MLIFCSLEEEQGIVHPEIQAAYVGSTVSITCVTFSNKTVTWLSPKRKKIKHATKSLLIKNITIKDSGKYTCKGYLHPTNTKFVAVAEILVGGSFEIFLLIF